MKQSLNVPFADEATVLAMRGLMNPKQRQDFDRLRANEARGPRGLARLNPQPPKPKLVVDNTPAQLAERLDKINAAVDTLSAEGLENLHVQEGSADAVVEVLVTEPLDEGMLKSGRPELLEVA